MDEYDSNYVKIPVILVYVALSFLFAFTIPNAQFIMMILGVELLITYGVLNEEGIVDTAEDWWIIAIGIAMILLGFVTTVLSCVKG
jgi:Kef-type K+ transport system membrane component KefB